MIKSISLQNWKSIKKSSTDLPSFCALVGENAAGKSNLIQSIKLIKVLVHGGTIEEFQSKISLLPSELINYSDQNNECKISLLLEDDDRSLYELTIRMILTNDKLTIGYEKLTKVSDETEETIYTRDINEFKVKGTEKFPLNYEQNRLALAY